MILRPLLLFPLAALALAALPVWAEDSPAPAASQPPASNSPAKQGPGPELVPHQPPAPVDPPGPEFDAPVQVPDAAAPSQGESGTPPGTETAEPATTDGNATEAGSQADTETGSEPGAAPDVVDDASADGVDTVEEAEPEGLPLKDLRIFAEVFGRIKSDYVEPVDDRKLLSSAIRGMLGGLDPHSAYLDPDEYKDLQVGTTGEFGGLGIEVGMEDGFVKVISPIDDTPAQRAGMQAGDLIVRIDGKPIKGMDLNEAVKLMRGKPGTSIELTVAREGEGSPLTISIERDVIKVASVKSRTLEPGYGYLRVASFQARTTEDLLKAVAELKQENTDGLKGVVLDLRNNPGGVLNAAVGVSDAFLEQGLIVYTKGRIDDSKLEFKAGPDDVLDGAPLVVLVNGGSASASEIVAGALQDQSRALIMGGKTFGKGSVQTIVPVDGRTALKLTTARYYTPSGRSIQAQGIEPDIELARGSVTLAKESGVEPLKEADLMRHLEEGDTADGEQADADAEDEAALAAEDYQLSEALNVLKGLSIYGQAAATVQSPATE
ncbi:MAG: S41 family peptidase [Thiohalocapsa sp.]